MPIEIDKLVPLRLEPRWERPTRIDREGRAFILSFPSGDQCIIKPEREKGRRRLYAFSTDVLLRTPWFMQCGDTIVVASVLVFEIVGIRDYDIGGNLVLAYYRGLVS